MINDTLKDQLVGKFKGFSRVIDALIESKKPVVGHNCFLDIMKIYHQFYKPLPYSYSGFKSDIHKCFPAVYDTKFLSYELRRRLEDAESDLCLPLVSSNLKSLFGSLNTMKNSNAELMYSPKINHAEGFEKYKEQDFCHEAGYDGYMTGYVSIIWNHHTIYLVRFLVQSSYYIFLIYFRYLLSWPTFQPRSTISVLQI